MPLATTTSVPPFDKPEAAYFILYSSIDEATGKMWCPDCVRVDDLITSTFAPEDAPTAQIVYVGQRNEWRGNPNNAFRGEPWGVSSVPTIIRTSDNARLVDDEITQGALAEFVRRD